MKNRDMRLLKQQLPEPLALPAGVDEGVGVDDMRLSQRSRAHAPDLGFLGARNAAACAHPQVSA